MENAIEIQVTPGTRNEGQRFSGKHRVRVRGLKRLSIVEWYQVLRVHHHWTIFQAIRFALWLAR